MKIVGVRELKDHLSEILRSVADGEAVLVRSRTEIVAEIRPAYSAHAGREIDPGVAAMIAAGELSAAGPNVPEVYPELPPVSCPTSRELLDAERGDS